MNLSNNPRASLVAALLIFAMLLSVGVFTQRTVSQPAPALAQTAEADVVPSTEWSPYRYVRVAGATLVPRDSTTSWDYSGAGCISASSGNDNFTIHLPIPNGSRIDYLRLYYYDTSANNSTAWVTTYDGAGGVSDVTSVSSTGSSGYGTTLSPYVGHVVDSINNSYVLNWRANQTGSTMRLCALRVAYRVPLDQTAFLPLVIR